MKDLKIVAFAGANVLPARRQQLAQRPDFHQPVGFSNY
jgi:hypothetical protein